MKCVYGYDSNEGRTKYFLIPEGSEIPEVDCTNERDDNCNGLADCKDPTCAGRIGPNGAVCCQSDEDCKKAGVTCDEKGYKNRYAQCDNEGDNPTYTCSICGPCQFNYHCEPGYCCTREIPGYTPPSGQEHQCVEKGTRINNVGGKSYICDPPLTFSVHGSKLKKENKVEVDLINYMLKFVYSLFNTFGSFSLGK